MTKSGRDDLMDGLPSSIIAAQICGTTTGRRSLRIPQAR